MLRVFFAALIAIGLVAPQIAAEELENEAARTVACLEIEDAAERLACLEEAASAMANVIEQEKASAEAPAAAQPSPEDEPEAPEWAKAPEPEPEPEPVQTAEPGSENEQEALPIWARILPGSNRDEAKQVHIVVTRILRNAAGRHYFLTEDGQEWRQTMTEPIRPPRSLPAAATISESLVGSPMLTFDDGPNGAYKVRRTK